MIKSIKLKLWLTLFITLVLSLGALLSLTYFSVKQRFLDNATQQILDRLELLEQAVLQEYKTEHTLDIFRESPARWNQLRDSTYRQYLRDQQTSPTNAFALQQKDWSERESLDNNLQPNQRAFFQHLILLDLDKKLIAGRPKENAKYVYRLLKYNDERLAYIGYIKPKAFLRSVEKLFVDQQIHTFAMLSIAMVFAALVVTLVLSRWLVAPLTHLANVAQKVATGNFSVRVDHKSNDELGHLCDNFNEMTHALEKNETIRKQWVADISHEMRTPLSVLKAQIEAMEDGIRPPTPENLQLLNKNVNAISGIIDDLYQLSLADLASLNLNKSRVNLAEMLFELSEEFLEKFSQKNIHIETKFDPHAHYTALIDVKRIQQVFTNLLENSVRYTDPDGLLRISITAKENYWQIDFEDTAPSVPNDALDKIFDRLYRVESSRNRETGGAGLGLSICESIIEAHDGKISASHSPLGGLKQSIQLRKVL